MMNVAELLRRCEATGIEMYRVGDMVRCRGPKSDLDALRPVIDARVGELLRLLPAAPCVKCRHLRIGEAPGMGRLTWECTAGHRNNNPRLRDIAELRVTAQCGARRGFQFAEQELVILEQT